MLSSYFTDCFEYPAETKERHTHGNAFSPGLHCWSCWGGGGGGGVLWSGGNQLNQRPYQPLVISSKFLLGQPPLHSTSSTSCFTQIYTCSLQLHAMKRAIVRRLFTVHRDRRRFSLYYNCGIKYDDDPNQNVEADKFNCPNQNRNSPKSTIALGPDGEGVVVVA